MARGTASSHLHIVSCYEDSVDGSIETMTRPLTNRPQESNASSLEAEEQTQIEEGKAQGGKSLVWEVFVLGSAIGFLLEVMSFAACHCKFKIWGQNPTFSGALSLISYSILVILSWLNVVIYTCIWFFFFYTMTSKLSWSGTPAGSSNSIGKAHMLCVVGIYNFAFGYLVGSCSVLIIVDFCMGLASPLMPLSMPTFLLFWILITCIEWGANKSGVGEQEEEEDDSFLV
jgi:hypothetical protein